MENLVLALFALALLACVSLGQPVLWALAAGYFIFLGYALYKKHSPGAFLLMSWQGVRTARNILLLFVMIGMLTALWRMAGTIPAIVYYTSGSVRPELMLLAAFLLNALISTLTGTSFGTAATMGVITMTMAGSMNIDPLLTGGAILSGCYVGDRCSPVSTSALLISELTNTDIFANIRLMLRTGAVPIAAAAAVYVALGLLQSGGGTPDASVRLLFASSFSLGLLPLLPALAILLLSLLRVNVKISLGCSILTAAAVSLLVQQVPPDELLRALIFGYEARDAALAPMLNGGGILSMTGVGAIVCLSSSFAGIFAGTGLLNGLKAHIAAASGRLSIFGCIALTAAAASMIACNQTLAIMLTHQLCRQLLPSRQDFAAALENSVVVIAPLVPWCIAGAAPMAAVGAPAGAVLAACYLYLLPLWRLMRQTAERHY